MLLYTHMKILHSLLKKHLTLFLCLILLNSPIIFAAPEDDDISINTSSEEIEEPFEAGKTQEKLTFEAGERVEEKIDTEELLKPARRAKKKQKSNREKSLM